ncbi:ribonuclease Z [Candidatus Uhrbacteria bacterium]|nr:ribonuclease Z [Candidatus Uhrbacteria bacterium]
MKPHFHPALINDPLGDPGLVVHFLHESRALLFDLGDLSAVPNAVLLKVSHVFVSHTHIDHFIGFDRFLRTVFGRGKTIRMYGPENFIDNVEGKLRGFTWNLVANYNESVTLDVVEVHEDHLLTARFRAIDKFKKTGEAREPLSGGVILDEPGFSIHTAILEHRVPCLGFALKEKFHVNIRKDRLESLNLAPGAWLNELKRAIHEQRTDDWPVRVPASVNGKKGFEERRLGDLKRDLVIISPGQKIAYVVDTVYNERNNRRIVELVRDADVFYCESPFIAEETERGRERCHLTSRQAGLLAREAGVKQLRTFHFSAKHSVRTGQLYREAEEAFRG